ncbi:MAG: hypothetical protein M1816_005933 [Peltula sp. TS41687]|nr:MAG: hypothetical protein M1816_005933 [Peltula sp. TS41687]
MFSAIEEIARVKHEIQKRLSKERSRRLEAEKRLKCFKISGKKRNKKYEGSYAVRNEEHLEKKLEIVARSISGLFPVSTDLKRENEALRRKIVSLGRELKENVKVQSEVDKGDTAGV